jgi:methylated-DNA-[protein]-cysteine S-methyltransferase
MHYTEHASPVGTLLLAATGRGISGLYFPEHRHFAGTQGWVRDDAHPLLLRLRAQLEQYFDGERRAFDLPLDMAGTPFQQRVWQQLATLPFGLTATYAAQAAAIGKPAAVRAVGSAIGRNPVSIVVPCHRVVAGNGALTGYAGGLERKRYLLALEAVFRETAMETAVGA